MTKKRKRRRRSRRQRMIMKIVKFAAITVILLGICALGLWLLLDSGPQTTIEKYPVEYEAFIRKHAEDNGIPPAYAAAVILAESSYRPEVVSSADARGLMQLLPSTGEWIAGKYDEAFSEEVLFDPETNIKYGCWYLGFLMRRYDGDMRCSSSAYHAGQGNVDKWLANPAYSADGKHLDVIPYESTGTYVERILKYYEKYEEIYSETY